MRFSSFDVYPKTLSEFRQRTLSGAVVSIACAILIALLAIVEVVDFASVKKTDHLFVDTSRGQPLRINLNITFPALPCSVISLDTLDLSGNHAPDQQRSISKTRLDGHGQRLPPSPPSPPGTNINIGRRLLFDAHDRGGGGAGGSAAAAAGAGAGGAPGQKRNLADLRHLGSQPDMLLSKLLAEILPTVLDDKEAVAELRTHIGEGCHIEGSVLVNKVAGNFHFSLTKADHHVLMTVYGQRSSINVSHVIHSISFGEPYPDMINPLDNTPKILYEGSGYFQYYIKIVPTTYEPLRGPPLHTNQYSYTELFRTTSELDKLPAVYFHYELSPIMAKVTYVRKAYSSFLTGLCAIVGGVFTVAGMIDSAIHRLSKGGDR